MFSARPDSHIVVILHRHAHLHDGANRVTHRRLERGREASAHPGKKRVLANDEVLLLEGREGSQPKNVIVVERMGERSFLHRPLIRLLPR